jgi:hypothetical protein
MHMIFTFLFHAYSTICSYIPYLFYSMAAFAMFCAIMPVAVIRSASSERKGQSREFFQVESFKITIGSGLSLGPMHCM